MAYFILFLASLLQTTFLLHFPIFNATPNLVLAALMVLWYNNALRLEWAIFGGLMLDLFSGTMIGVNIFIFAAVWLIMKIINSKIVNNSPIVFSLSLFFLTIIFNALFIIINGGILEKQSLDLFQNYPRYMISLFLLEAVYNIILFNIGIYAAQKFKKTNTRIKM